MNLEQFLIFWAPGEVVLLPLAPFPPNPVAQEEKAQASEFTSVLETWENFGGWDSENQKSVRA